MANFLIIILCFLAGVAFRKSKTLPPDAHKSINAWIIYIALPALSFKYLPHISWTSHLIFPAVAPILVWLFAWVLITVYSRINNLNKATTGGLKLVSGLSNTSFIGFPLIMAYFSDKELAIAIICDQITFSILATFGVLVAIRSSEKQKVSIGLLLKKAFSFPPLIACVLSLTLPHFVDISFLDPLFDKLSITVGPLALFSIGLQLKFGGWFAQLKLIRIALFYKLILAPALIFLIAILLQLNGIISKITVFEMAMPSQLTSAVIVEQYNLNPKLANMVVGLGIMLGFVTTGIWWLVLERSGWL